MNRPMTHGKFTLYQSSAQQLAHGVETSTLNAVYDPGRLLKYLGSLMTCSGLAIMFLMRAFSFKKASGLPTDRESPRQSSVAQAASVPIPHSALAPARQRFGAAHESDIASR